MITDRATLGCASVVARALQGSLHAVYAFDPPPIGKMPAKFALSKARQAIEHTAEARARVSLNRTLGRANIQQSNRHVVSRHPIDAIESTAREIDTSIVVMGAVSRSGLERTIIGNTAERVLDHLACDVLIVKPKRLVSRVPRSRRDFRLVAFPGLQPGI